MQSSHTGHSIFPTCLGMCLGKWWQVTRSDLLCALLSDVHGSGASWPVRLGGIYPLLQQDFVGSAVAGDPGLEMSVSSVFLAGCNNS